MGRIFLPITAFDCSEKCNWEERHKWNRVISRPWCVWEVKGSALDNHSLASFPVWEVIMRLHSPCKHQLDLHVSKLPCYTFCLVHGKAVLHCYFALHVENTDKDKKHFFKCSQKLPIQVTKNETILCYRRIWLQYKKIRSGCLKLKVQQHLQPHRTSAIPPLKAMPASQPWFFLLMGWTQP